MNTALITGATSGIGYETAMLLASKGYRVYAGARDLEKGARLTEAAEKKNLDIIIIKLDVTDEKSIMEAVMDMVSKEGRIDVLVNNAGYGLLGAAEAVSIKQAQKQFDVNFFGVLRMLKAVLPYMRRQKSGKIVNISSIAGIRGRAGSDIYAASKFALEGLSESMAPELAHFGIRMMLIEPGPTKTNFLPSEELPDDEKINEIYEPIISKMRENREERFKQAQLASEVAKVIFDAIQSDNPHVRYQPSESSKKLVALEKIDPTGDNYFKEVLDILNKD